MRTITLVVYNRPRCVVQAVGALAEALLKLDTLPFDKLLISIDPGNMETAAVCERAAEILSDSGTIDCDIYTNAQRFGTDGNTRLALERAFEEHNSDFNVHIEDDAVLMPDALLLANWFYECHGGPLADYVLMAMCNHRAFGRGNNPGGIPDDPRLLSESPYITAPFAWCMSRWQWPFIKRTWNCKELPPNGWAFSLSFAMRLEKRRTLHPILSRCKNIGREGGANETPETFDRTQVGLIHSDGKYDGPYQIAVRIKEGELDKLDNWMLTEVERMKKR